MTTSPPASLAGLSLRTLRVRRQDAVLTIELNCPERGNIVTDAMLDDLQTVLDHQDPDIRVVVLAGAGDDFCVGGDLAEYADHVLSDPAGGGVRLSGVKARRVCELLLGNPAVTIARVQGHAVGIGLGLAVACDLRVGSEDSSFRLPELHLGVPMAWGGLLPRMLSEVGVARGRELVLTGRRLRAPEALELSLLHKVVPAAELDAALAAWTEPITRRPAAALRVTKALLNSYSAASRTADAAALDPELMAMVMADVYRGGNGPDGDR
jgi:enoyl-CoA hydratase/carnithine racemase